MSFEAIDPTTFTAKQLNKRLESKGKSGLGPVPADSVVVAVGILLPASFTQADVAALEAAVEAMQDVSKAIVCGGLRAPGAEWTPADHDLRFALQTRLIYEPITPPE